MRFNLVGAFVRNHPFGTEIAFRKGLERIGHAVNTVDTSFKDQHFDLDADFTIVFKWMEGYWEQLEACRGKKIVYQPDDARFPHIREMLAKMRKYCDYALTFDTHAARNITPELGYLRSQRLLLTADDELYRPDWTVKKDIDFCFIGSMSGVHGPHRSRHHMVNTLRNNGFRVVAGELHDVHAIVELYNRSKVVLNHATDVGQDFGTGYGLQCRHFEAGLAGAIVFSNWILEEEPLMTGIYFSDERSLLKGAETIMKDDEWREQATRDYYGELVAGHLPQHRAADIVKFVESL